MTRTRSRMMGACGLACRACEIRRAPHDEEAARVVVGWFRERGWRDEDEGITEVIEWGRTRRG